MRKKKGFAQAAPLRHHSGLIQKNARLNMTLRRRDHKQRLPMVNSWQTAYAFSKESNPNPIHFMRIK